MTSVLNRIRIFAIFATILMLGTLATPVTAAVARDEEDRLVATYGGYGIHYLMLGHYGPISSWATLEDASVDILFSDDGATGVIILGDKRFEVELEKVDTELVADGTCITHKSIEDGILFEGDILNHDGEVKLIRYHDVVVGEIDLGEIVYRFDVAGSLLSAGTILIQHNDEYVEKLFEMGILQLPEMPQLAPPVEPDEDDIHKIDYEPEFICPDTQYVPSLKQLLAAGDDVIPLLLVTEPHRVEELRELSELNGDVLTLVAGYTLSHIEEDKDIDEIIELLEGITTAEDNGIYLEELEQLVGPIGGNSSWRHVSVRAVADEEYMAYHGTGWISAMDSAIEAGDNRFASDFMINFWVGTSGIWYSHDGHTTLSGLFDEMRDETNHGWADVVVGFTNQDTPACTALGMAERPGNDAIAKQHGLIHRILWHEFSHLFNCTCYATVDYHPWYCIMSWWWVIATGWCGECIHDITENKWRVF